MRSGIPVRNSDRVYAESYLDYKSEVFIFIEDKNEMTRKIMLELIQRAISQDIKIDRIYSLDGREKVLDAFKNKNNERTEIYIIDGDLNMQYENDYFKKGLVILDRYCIENYLLDKNAILDLLYEESKSCEFDELSDRFDFDNWFDVQSSLLNLLFSEYAIEKKFKLGIITVKYPVNKLRSRESKNKLLCKLDVDLVKQRLDSLRQEIIDLIGETEYNNTKNIIVQNIDKFESIKYVSAKDYILPLVFERLKKIAENTRADTDNLKYRLSKKCQINSFKDNLLPHLN